MEYAAAVSAPLRLWSPPARVCTLWRAELPFVPGNLRRRPRARFAAVSARHFCQHALRELRAFRRAELSLALRDRMRFPAKQLTATFTDDLGRRSEVQIVAFPGAELPRVPLGLGGASTKCPAATMAYHLRHVVAPQSALDISESGQVTTSTMSPAFPPAPFATNMASRRRGCTVPQSP